MLLQQHLPFTVLKPSAESASFITASAVLQQHLPFTVLKHKTNVASRDCHIASLQQHLPFTVLKRGVTGVNQHTNIPVATALTVYGIETY